MAEVTHRFVETNGIRMHIAEKGSGPLVLLCHGFPKPEPRIQTSVRLDSTRWAALNDLATRERVEDGSRVTVHDLMIEGVDHVLALNGIKASR